MMHRPYSECALTVSAYGDQGDPDEITVPEDIEASPQSWSTIPSREDSHQMLCKPRDHTRQHLAWLKSTLLKYNVECRGIDRVLPEHRHDLTKLGVLQICLFWISTNLEALMVILGMLGPTLYHLPFLESALLGIFGSMVGAFPVAYIATFGPRSGNRTMVLTRYVTGWYPSKVVDLLTLVVILGYSTVNSVVGGQILSTISSGNNLAIVSGIVVICLITWVVSTFGYGAFHMYERYAWLPQLVVLSVLAGVAGPKFDLYGNPSSALSKNTVAGNRLSYFSLCLASQITYAPAGADYFVYYPPTTSKAKVFLATMLGLTISSALTLIIGTGLGSGTAANTGWSEAYHVSEGALIVEALRPLGSFGSLCSVVIALSLVSNMVPGTYASGIDFQALGRYCEKVQRVTWNSVAILIPMACAIAGRERLAQVLTNFLSLVGYWVCIWIAIFLEEYVIFRTWMRLDWNWEIWDDRVRLPHGVAAVSAFLIGWVGTILCMAQVWFVGPLARQISVQGGDVSDAVFDASMFHSADRA